HFTAPPALVDDADFPPRIGMDAYMVSAPGRFRTHVIGSRAVVRPIGTGRNLSRAFLRWSRLRRLRFWSRFRRLRSGSVSPRIPLSPLHPCPASFAPPVDPAVLHHEFVASIAGSVLVRSHLPDNRGIPAGDELVPRNAFAWNERCLSGDRAFGGFPRRLP